MHIFMCVFRADHLDRITIKGIISGEDSFSFSPQFLIACSPSSKAGPSALLLGMLFGLQKKKKKGTFALPEPSSDWTMAASYNGCVSEREGAAVCFRYWLYPAPLLPGSFLLALMLAWWVLLESRSSSFQKTPPPTPFKLAKNFKLQN